jgi:hypothetical protein
LPLRAGLAVDGEALGDAPQQHGGQAQQRRGAAAVADVADVADVAVVAAVAAVAAVALHVRAIPRPTRPDVMGGGCAAFAWAGSWE